MRRRWQRLQGREVQSVDVTPFLSLMVILVPFLLVTAAFSRTTILEIQAAGQAHDGAREEDLALRVIVREAAFEVFYMGQEQPRVIERSSGGTALRALADLATELKSSRPQNENATVLVEPEIPYELVVQVLDVLRMHSKRSGTTVITEPLFPQIALGPAPAFTGGEAVPQ